MRLGKLWVTKVTQLSLSRTHTKSLPETSCQHHANPLPSSVAMIDPSQISWGERWGKLFLMAHGATLLNYSSIVAARHEQKNLAIWMSNGAAFFQVSSTGCPNIKIGHHAFRAAPLVYLFCFQRILSNSGRIQCICWIPLSFHDILDAETLAELHFDEDG